MNGLSNNKLKEGGARLLTLGEIQLARTVFRSSIDYDIVLIPGGKMVCY